MVLTHLVLTVCLGNIILQGDCKTSVASEAILNILETQFSGNWQSKVDLIYFGDAIEVADMILHHSPTTVSVKVIDGGADVSAKEVDLPKDLFPYSRDSEDVKFLHWNNVLRKSTVLLFESAQQYKSHIGNITWLGNRWFRYNHVIYAPNLTLNDVVETTKNGFEIDAAAFLMNETVGSIELVSSYMFTEQNCRHNQMRTINRYNAQASKWETNDFHPPKYRSFYNCTLSFVEKPMSHPDPVPCSIIANVPSSNFVPSQLKLAYENRNASTTDMITGMSLIFYELRSTEIYSTATIFTSIVCYLPDGEPYSLIEKMFMMFDVDVWIAIGCTLLFWFVSIRVINVMPKKIQDLIFGKSINTPTMNLLDIFLNGGQHKIPTNKLAKYLLMLFVIWSLIIRTCYQSKLFEYLQVDIRKTYSYNLSDIRFKKTKLTLASDCQPSQCLDYVAEYLNQKYFVGTYDTFVRITQSFYRSGKSSLRVHEENVVTWSFMPTFFEFSPYFQEFNDRIGRLLASGFYGDGRLTAVKKPRAVEDIGPQVLTFEHLQLGFVACLILLVLSIIVFIMEVTVPLGLTLITRVSLYFAIKAFERRLVIGPERLQQTEDEEEIGEVTSLESCASDDSCKDHKKPDPTLQLHDDATLPQHEGKEAVLSLNHK